MGFCSDAQTENNDPDWTSGTLIGKTPEKGFYVLDQVWLQGTPAEVEALVRNTASRDGNRVSISIPQDPGQAGKSQALSYVRQLVGYRVEATPEARNSGGLDNQTASRVSTKVTRFSPFSAQAQAGNVRIVRRLWNDRWFGELEAFAEAAHDDSADSTPSCLQTPEPTKRSISALW